MYTITAHKVWHSSGTNKILVIYVDLYTIKLMKKKIIVYFHKSFFINDITNFIKMLKSAFYQICRTFIFFFRWDKFIYVDIFRMENMI